MILESLKYIRHNGKSNEWTLADKDGNAVQFGNTNLIVGKNAAGKSRTLAEVGEIANLLSLKKDITKLKSSNWECQMTFKEDGDLYRYRILVENESIKEETLSVNDKLKFDRGENKIFSQKTNKFETYTHPANEIIISARENQAEYPYLFELFEWGNALKRFTFTNQLDKNRLIKREELETLAEIDPDNINTIQLFYKGKEFFGDNFIKTIISDMKRLDYSISEITLEETRNGIGISVHEEELSESTLQTDMSQGMYRALAFIIEMNLALLSKVSVCLLIDDLGEGLDFSRSKSLIDLLIYKINNSDIQIFITTNDRYVMNTIPIKYWSILERKPKASVFYNYYNSRNVFDDFKYTGLNNFDFLATDFYLHGFENEPEDI